MTRLARLCFVPLALAAAAGVAAAGPLGNGGPSPGIAVGLAGVPAPDGTVRFVALPAGGDTAVAAVGMRGGRVVRFRSIPGSYGVPLVAYDGSAGGLSVDGKTLVLATNAPPSAPGAITSFAVLAAKTLKLRHVVKLRGSWSFDALSPNGSTLYLIQYLASQSPRYQVRAYDLAAGSLLATPIVDKRERDEQMQGYPLTRATSRDGGWVYTLYRTDVGQPFIHALDTRHRAAVCIDLPWEQHQNGLDSVRIAFGNGGTQLVLSQHRRGTLAVVDTRTFTVRALAAPAGPGDVVG